MRKPRSDDSGSWVDLTEEEEAESRGTSSGHFSSSSFDHSFSRPSCRSGGRSGKRAGRAQTGSEQAREPGPAELSDKDWSEQGSDLSCSESNSTPGHLVVGRKSSVRSKHSEATSTRPQQQDRRPPQASGDDGFEVNSDGEEVEANCYNQKLHDSNQCKCCSFFNSKAGCKMGIKCDYCHLPHPERRVRPSKAKRKKCKAAVNCMAAESVPEGTGPAGRASIQSSYMNSLVASRRDNRAMPVALPAASGSAGYDAKAPGMQQVYQ